MKFKIQKIKCSRLSLWRCGLVAFLLLFVVIFLVNIYLFLKMKKEMAGEAPCVNYQFVVIKQDLYKQTQADLKSRKEAFEKILSEEVSIKDPSI